MFSELKMFLKNTLLMVKMKPSAGFSFNRGFVFHRILYKIFQVERFYCNHSFRNVYLLDEDSSQDDCDKKPNKYSQRTHNCGELRPEHVGKNVTLCGWLEFQRMNKFAVLRDTYGETQIIVNEDQKTGLSGTELRLIPYESVIKVIGTVALRPENTANKKQSTGEIEVIAENFSILNKAKEVLPFNIRDFQRAKEPLRMKYRYLDLRFPQMQRNLKVRSQFIMKMREFLINECKFCDIETPTLFKATPGGAQEFIVPTRFPGQFYSLVQSPQQFKQMLMAGGVDRYFQIARCYRDETTRPDRQPEFTQLDLEMSFTDTEGVKSLIEDLLHYAWPQISSVPKKFKQISYDKALEEYGSDKPDTRFNFKLKNCTEVLIKNHDIMNQCKNFSAYCIIIPQEYVNLSNKVKEYFFTLSKMYPSAKLIQSKIKSLESWCKSMDKLFNEKLARELVDSVQVADNSLMFLSYGERKDVLSLLGKIRLEYADHLENLGLSIREKGIHMLWVVDFPLFEQGDAPGKLVSTHHPFTSPHPSDLDLLDSAPLKVRSLAYDLVLNGNEVGGGSIRIHDPLLQEKIFRLLDIDKTTMTHFIEMLSSGCPPHGGIALGLDRLLTVILNETSIRDVIAFPKNFEGRDPLSGAPSSISEREQKLYHIKVDTSKNL